jgi:mRNA interferase RelE/StbE
VKWEIVLDETAVREFDDLDKTIQKRVARFLYERVAKLEDPRGIGEALKGASLGEFWKYRVGDYRLIAKIRDQYVQILIIKIGNRREVYR